MLENACFTNGWSEEQIKIALESKNFLFLGIYHENELVSYISLQCIPSVEKLENGECEIINIATRNDYRRKGLAEQLLIYVLTFTKNNKVDSILLDVRESNKAARALYSKVGFVEVGRRKNYYPLENNEANSIEKNFEDGLIMKYTFV